jgi:hypothetical protein
LTSQDRDGLVGGAVKAEHRGLQLGGEVDRIFWLQFGARPVDRPVPRDRGLQARVVCGIYPDRPAAPAKSGDAEPGRVALAGRFGVDDRGVEIPDHLGIRHFRYHLGDQLRDIRVCRRIALARVELGRDREIAGLGEAPADVLDVFVDTKDFLNNQDGRKRPARRRHRPVRGASRRRRSAL